MRFIYPQVWKEASGIALPDGGRAEVKEQALEFPLEPKYQLGNVEVS